MSDYRKSGEETPVRLLKMEEELAGAQGAEALARYDRQLVELGRRCQAAMDAGGNPTCRAFADMVLEKL